MSDFDFESLIEYRGYTQNNDTEHPFFGVTVCFLRLKNGFVCTGVSKCFNPEDYDPEEQQEMAYDSAILELMGHMEFGALLAMAPSEDEEDIVEAAAGKIDPVFLDLSGIANQTIQ